ncbi:MAG TPA: RsmE family RNA methyltransferase [Methylomirabilota bacterium]|nr:RsmE family RNA methyltransferase [Methylomirabilota bacterium]
MRRRFFVEQFGANRCVLQGEAAHHLGRVLRAAPGQLYELSDGRRVRLGRIEKVGRDAVEFALLEELPATEPTLRTTLLLAVVKFEAFEWAVEKATELGVGSIAPLAAARSEKALVAAASKRGARWRKILLEAAQQSRRLRLPELGAVTRPEQAFRERREALRLLLSERPEAARMRTVLSSTKASEAALAVGPEGGWTDEEIALAREAGFRDVSLGKGILRTETAVIAGLAALNYALGEE